MSVIDKLSSISDTLSKIFQYAQKNPEIKRKAVFKTRTFAGFIALNKESSSIVKITLANIDANKTKKPAIFRFSEPLQTIQVIK